MKTLNNLPLEYKDSGTQSTAIILETNYKELGDYFCRATGLKIEKQFIGIQKHFEGDKETRPVWSIVFKRGNRQYAFNFGDSVHEKNEYIFKLVARRGETYSGTLIGYYLKCFEGGTVADSCSPDGNSFFKKRKEKYFPKEPTAYTLLACMTKYEPESTLEDFCSTFGYDSDSKSAEKTYNEVCKEFAGIQALFNDEEIEWATEYLN